MPALRGPSLLLFRLVGLGRPGLLHARQRVRLGRIVVRVGEQVGDDAVELLVEVGVHLAPPAKTRHPPGSIVSSSTSSTWPSLGNSSRSAGSATSSVARCPGLIATFTSPAWTSSFIASRRFS